MEIKPYKAGDEADILELFKLAFKKEMSIEYWNWRFKNNPFSQDILIHLMWDKNKLVGQYAVSPVEMLVEGEKMKAALVMTLMTHPDYMGKGIFPMLGKSLHSDLQNKYNYKMLYAFPNNNSHSHYGFVKNLYWKDIAILPMLSLKLTNLRFKNSGNLSYSIIDSFSGLAEILNTSEKLVKLNKTETYLNWRYLRNPSEDYKIITVQNGQGIAVYKILKSFHEENQIEIDIMELVYENEEILLEILHSIVHNEKKLSVNALNIWKSIFASDFLLFEKLGFKIGLPLNYLSHLSFGNSNIISNYKNWEIGLGYSDVF
ncbi:GNAT family N-acetyltransferase [Salinimicrobium sp. TIG7-5_MAKvit]|uniref:GNAT family N-acetyltransferase n=1 Tax=Salinimicrobium sp. TIG7-5_MAKvit TaxID=3121289 RepID=UPI003C6E179C